MVVYEYQNRPRELNSTNGFALEYDSRVTEQELYDDIISYLGEYRLKLPRYDYNLEFSMGTLKDTHRGEAMSVKAARSVRERMMRGESINREAAEATGLSFLDMQIETALDGDSIVWASPPGDAEEGYGEYGFFYVGQIRRSVENKKQIKMSALRVEKPTIEGFNLAFSDLTGLNIEAGQPEDFLKMPLVINDSLSMEQVEEVLNKHFSYQSDNDWQDIFKERIKPWVDEFIARFMSMSVEERRKGINALENKTLEIKSELEKGMTLIYAGREQFDDFVSLYGHEPPKEAGSCPIKSNNVFNQGFENINNMMESEWYTCPNQKCGYKASGPIGDTCPGCGLTKEEYAKTSAQVCN